MSGNHLAAMVNAIEEAERDGLLRQTKDVSGFSGEKLVGMLQRLARCQRKVGCYLEIGVFQGLTLVSVGNALDGEAAYGVDNFAQFDPDGTNERTVKQRLAANGLTNVSLVNADYEDALASLPSHIGERRVGTYFVDGPHDYRSQIMCLLMALPHLGQGAVIVVDDCNYRHVRQANSDFLRCTPSFKLLYEAYTPCHPGNLSGAALERSRKGFWNGVNVIVHDPDDLLPAMYPPTMRDRTLYLNEHRIHSAEHGYLAPEAIELCSAIMRFRPVRSIRRLGKMVVRMVRPNGQLKGRFESMNTFSEDLPNSRFNQVPAESVSPDRVSA